MDNHFKFYHKEKARFKSNSGGRGDQGKYVCFLLRWGKYSKFMTIIQQREENDNTENTVDTRTTWRLGALMPHSQKFIHNF